MDHVWEKMGEPRIAPQESASIITSLEDPETKLGAADHLLPPLPPSTDSFLCKPLNPESIV